MLPYLWGQVRFLSKNLLNSAGLESLPILKRNQILKVAFRRMLYWFRNMVV